MAKYSAPSGRSVVEARVLLNTELDGRNGCYVYYSKAENSFRLVDDSGSGSTKPASGASSLENSQCSLDLAQSSAQPADNSLTLQLSLKFKPPFKGKKSIFLYAEAADGSNSGITSKGSWNVAF